MRACESISNFGAFRAVLMERELVGACGKGDGTRVALALQVGTDVNCTSGLRKFTPLMKAAEQGHVEICRTLIEHDADLTSKDSQGRTALDIAKSKEHAAVVQILQQAGNKCSTDAGAGAGAGAGAINDSATECVFELDSDGNLLPTAAVNATHSNALPQQPASPGPGGSDAAPASACSDTATVVDSASMVRRAELRAVQAEERAAAAEVRAARAEERAAAADVRAAQAEKRASQAEERAMAAEAARLLASATVS